MMMSRRMVAEADSGVKVSLGDEGGARRGLTESDTAGLIYAEG